MSNDLYKFRVQRISLNDELRLSGYRIRAASIQQQDRQTALLIPNEVIA